MGKRMKSPLWEMATHAALRPWEEPQPPRLEVITSDAIPKDRILFMQGPDCVVQIINIGEADE